MKYKDRQLEELYTLKHKNDDDADFIDYEDVILSKSLSPRIYENDVVATFLDKISKMVASFFDDVNIVKNFKNFSVDKDYFKHKN